jgi:hypothetical protein
VMINGCELMTLGVGVSGWPAKHGVRFALADPAALPPADEQLRADRACYGHVTVSARAAPETCPAMPAGCSLTASCRSCRAR